MKKILLAVAIAALGASTQAQTPAGAVKPVGGIGNSGGGGAASITFGSTVFAGFTNQAIIINNAGVAGELVPGAGCSAFLATPSSANLRGCITDETGTGLAVFATSPTFGGTVDFGTASTITGIIRLFHASNAFFSSFTNSASQTADAAYTLPTALPTVDGQSIRGTTGGVLFWVTPAPAPLCTTTVAGSDVVNSTTTPADITGLVCNLAANTRYLIECDMYVDSAATATGTGITWDGTATPGVVMGSSFGSTASAGGGDKRIVTGDDTGLASAGTNPATNHHFFFRGIWNNVNAGNHQMRFFSEVGASAVTIKIGSVCTWRQH